MHSKIVRDLPEYVAVERRRRVVDRVPVVEAALGVVLAPEKQKYTRIHFQYNLFRVRISPSHLPALLRVLDEEGVVDVVVRLQRALPVPDDPPGAALEVVAHQGLPLVARVEVLVVAAVAVGGAGVAAGGGGADERLHGNGVLPAQPEEKP